LNRLPPAQLAVTASATRQKDFAIVHVRLQNKGNSAALQAKLTLMDSDGRTRLLPAYYGDNYFSLLPGETKDIDIQSPNAAITSSPTLRLRGWNIPDKLFTVSLEK
jgi:hypothetical protein